MHTRIVGLSVLLGIIAAAVLGLVGFPSMSDAVAVVPPQLRIEVIQLTNHGLLTAMAATAGAVALAAYCAMALAILLPLRRLEGAVDELRADGSTEEVDQLGRQVFGRLTRALIRQTRNQHEREVALLAQVKKLSHSAVDAARLQSELVVSDRMATLGKLASGVAHEVGNPLAGILGYLTVLRMQSQVPAQLEVIDRVEAEVQRIDSIIRSLLEIGRPSRGKAEPIDVCALVDASVKLFRATPDLRGVKVEVVGPRSLFLRCESGPVSQVLLNLLLNAGQAMGGTGEITITIDDVANSLSVRDRGPGLSPEVQKHLFEPFFTTKPPGKGTGLGLAVSRHLLSQFGGTIDAENAKGQGALFTIKLPPA